MDIAKDAAIKTLPEAAGCVCGETCSRDLDRSNSSSARDSLINEALFSLIKNMLS